MEAPQISIRTTINADRGRVWSCYTEPEHITGWNFASPEWHCPHASNDLRKGGIYLARMEAKDGSFGFDFEAVYDEVVIGEKLIYTLGDGRKVTVLMNSIGSQTDVNVVFDAEMENSVELQRDGWQAILNNFKIYVES